MARFEPFCIFGVLRVARSGFLCSEVGTKVRKQTHVVRHKFNRLPNLSEMMRVVRFSSNPTLPEGGRDYWLLRRDRTCASSAIGSTSPCPRQVYAFTWEPPSFAVDTPET